jgi:16S rRNA processing protein RimM
MGDLIAIGKIAKVHGTSGEVIVLPFSDDTTPFLTLNHVFINGEERKRIEACRDVHGNSSTIRNAKKELFLQFQGINDRDMAQKLVGKTLEVERKDLPSLPEGTFFTFEILGLKVVTDSNKYVGAVVDILKLPGQDVYLVKTDKGEILIPAIDSVVKKIDLKDRSMVITPMEGLLQEST